MHLVVVSHACVTDVNQQIYAEIEKLGHKVDLIVPSNFVAPGLALEPISVKRWPEFKGRIIEIPTALNKSIPLHFYRKSMKSYFREYKPDAVYVAEEPYSLSCFQAIKCAIPYTKAIGFYSAQNINKNYPYLFRKIEKYVYRHSKVAVSISRDVTTVLRDKGYEKNICEIPLGVDEDHFVISSQLKLEAKKQCGIPSDAYVIGYAGRLVEEKGVDLLLKASSQMMNSIKNIYIMIVGRGPQAEELKVLAKKLSIRDKVLFIENAVHSDMPKWFNCMDVHVLPSKTMSNWREQFGRVLIEAAACGVPTIGSSSGEIPVVLKSLGMASIFEEGNVEELKNQLLVIKKSDYNPEIIRGKAVDMYGNKSVAQQLISAFSREVV
ncbi:glycosyltransferase [Niallia taxi]|uniref:glycosyltransferase n=1 Tax=Niallia taxi TaxID=2499688 RepID=UPI00398194BA